MEKTQTHKHMLVILLLLFIIAVFCLLVSNKINNSQPEINPNTNNSCIIYGENEINTIQIIDGQKYYLIKDILIPENELKENC